MSKEKAVFIVEELLGRSSKFHSLTSEKFTIGRSDEAVLRLADAGISRVHVVIWLQDGQIWIEDQNSKNGTRINDAPIPPSRPYPIQEGDVVQLGSNKQIRLALGPAARKAQMVPTKSAADLERESKEAFQDLMEKTLIEPGDEPRPPPIILGARGAGAEAEDAGEGDSENPSSSDVDISPQSAVLEKTRILPKDQEHFPPKPQVQVPKVTVEAHQAKKVLAQADLIRKDAHRSSEAVLSEARMEATRIKEIAEFEAGDLKRKMLDLFDRETGRAKKEATNLLREAERAADKLTAEAERRLKEVEGEAKQSAREIIARAETEAQEMAQKSDMAKSYARRELEEINIQRDQAAKTLEGLREEITAARGSRDEAVRALADIRKELDESETEFRNRKQQLNDERQALELQLESLQREVAAKEDELRDLILESEKTKRAMEQAVEEERRALAAQKNALVLASDIERRRKETAEECELLSGEQKRLETAIENLREEKRTSVEELKRQRQEADDDLKGIRAAAVEEIEFYKETVEIEAFKLMEEAETEVRQISDQLTRALEAKREAILKDKNEFEQRKADFELKAENRAREVINEAQRQADLMIKNAEKWAEDNFSNSRRKAEQELEHIRIEKRTMVEKAEEELLKLQKEMRNLRDESQGEAEHLVRQAKDEAREELQAARSMAENELAIAREKVREMLEGAENQGESKKAEAQRVFAEAHLKAQEQLALARKSVEESQRRAKEEVDELVSSAERKAAFAMAEAERKIAQDTATWEERKRKIAEEVTRLRGEAESQNRALIESAQGKAETILRNAQKDYDERLKDVQDELARTREQARADRERLEAEFKAETEKLKAKAAAEYNEQRRKDTLELSAFKLKQVEEAKAARADEDRQVRLRRQEEADQVADNIEKAVLIRIDQIAPKGVDPVVVEDLSKEVKSVVKRILNDEAVNNEDELKRLIEFDQKKDSWRVRRRRRQVMYGVSATASVVLLFYLVPVLFPAFSDRVRSIASVEKTGQDLFVEEIQRRRDSRPKFSPEQTPDFKNSYVENVLYTTSFVERKLSKEYQADWIMHLNKLFLNEFKMNENVIVNFISRENTLLKDLIQIRQTLQPATAEEGIRRMREVEDVAMEDLKQILGGRIKLKKFNEFARGYYSNYREPAAATDSPAGSGSPEAVEPTPQPVVPEVKKPEVEAKRPEPEAKRPEPAPRPAAEPPPPPAPAVKKSATEVLKEEVQPEPQAKAEREVPARAPAQENKRPRLRRADGSKTKANEPGSEGGGPSENEMELIDQIEQEIE